MHKGGIYIFVSTKILGIYVFGSIADTGNICVW